jgi:hypothetical protein
MRSKNRFGLELRIKEREIERLGVAGGIWCPTAEVLWGLVVCVRGLGRDGSESWLLGWAISVSFAGLLFRSGCLGNSGIRGAYPNFLIQVQVFKLATRSRTRNFRYQVFRVQVQVFRVQVLGTRFFCPLLGAYLE